MPTAVVLRDGSKRIWIEAVTDDPTNQRWAFRFMQGVVGQENVDRLAEELHAAIAAAFLRWQENEARIVQERPQVWEGITLSTNVTNFIFDHLLPSLMHRKQSGKRLKTHKILELIVALEPDQFIGLVLVYAHRIGDRDGVSRAFDIFMLPSSFYRQHLKAYRDSHAGGLEKAFHAKAGLKKRNQEILNRRNELLAKGKLKRNIAGILGKEFNLTATSIRGILKNTKS